MFNRPTRPHGPLERLPQGRRCRQQRHVPIESEDEEHENDGFPEPKLVNGAALKGFCERAILGSEHIQCAESRKLS